MGYMTNIWRRGPLTTNPYYETAFQALGILCDVTSLLEIGQKVEQRRQVVQNMPGYYSFGERSLTGPDITRAHQVMSDPTRRILEELLEHRPEQLEVEEIERLQARLMMPDWPEKTPPPRHLAFLLRAVQEFALEFLKNLPPVEVSPFPIDVTPIPPFDLVEKDKDDTY
jgi:hypothetical protein